MDRIELLASVALPDRDALYPARRKAHDAALLLVEHPSQAALLASEMSDVGRALLASATPPSRVDFSLVTHPDAVSFQIDFHWPASDAQPSARPPAMEPGTQRWPLRRAGNDWILGQSFTFNRRRRPAIDLLAIQQILQAKTREELFNDLNAKNIELNREVEERKLTEDNLRRAQEELIASEKLAALGGLVAGIAHEINTPVGIGVTAASHLSETIKEFRSFYQSGQMRRSDLERLLETIERLNGMVEENLHRASRLIRSFKEVAVDQTADDVREIVLKEYIDHVVTSLSPKLRNRPVQVLTDAIDSTISLKTSPGPISQIFTNLIVNSLVHAYDPEQAGTIRIAAKVSGQDLELVYSDDGKGIAPEHIKKIFDPFFTTKREHGGSGLGMHLVYNIVTKKYLGKIRCESQPGQGVTFHMTFPGLLRR